MYNNIRDILESEPFELFEWLKSNFTYDIPGNVSSEMEMRKAGNLMGEITNTYSFLCSLEGEISMHYKMLKLDKNKKNETNLMNLRRLAVHTYVEILSKQYNCISRMITIKIEADKELHMSDGYMER